MTIKDKKIRNNLRLHGYSKLPIIDFQSIDKLLEIYNNNILPDLPAGSTYWSMVHGNRSEIAQIHKEIVAIMFPHLLEHFINIKPLASSYMVKPGHSPSVAHHQDWTFIENEPIENSFTCWVPLVDTTHDNGMLGFVKGSHNEYIGYRGSPSPHYRPLFPEDSSIFHRTEYIPLKAGEPIVFNHRVIHASLPNKTDNVRPAIGISFANTSSRLIHIFLKPNTESLTVIKYAIDTDFYEKYSNMTLEELYLKGKTIENYEKLEEITLQSFQISNLQESTLTKFNKALKSILSRVGNNL